MPIPRGEQIIIPKTITPELLTTLDNLGHNHRIVVVDHSYDIPVGFHRRDVVELSNESSPQVAADILGVMPADTEDSIVPMLPNENDPPEHFRAMKEFNELVPSHGEALRCAYKGAVGFYAMVNSLQIPTTFIKTMDPRPYACVTWLNGHVQNG